MCVCVCVVGRRLGMPRPVLEGAAPEMGRRSSAVAARDGRTAFTCAAVTLFPLLPTCFTSDQTQNTTRENSAVHSPPPRAAREGPLSTPVSARIGKSSRRRKSSARSNAVVVAQLCRGVSHVDGAVPSPACAPHSALTACLSRYPLPPSPSPAPSPAVSRPPPLRRRRRLPTPPTGPLLQTTKTQQQQRRSIAEHSHTNTYTS